MFIRPKVVLTFLGLCLVPLILLALINHWNSVRIAKAALQKNQDDGLADFKSKVSDLLNEDQTELIKLSRSRALHDYIRTRGEGKASSPATQSTEESSKETELRISLASVLNTSSHFASIALLERNTQPLFLAENQGESAEEPIVFHTTDFLSEQAHPDDRVWTAADEPSPLSKELPGFISSVSLAPFGARIDYTVPIFSQRSDVRGPQGALVGVLKLDPIFSAAARANTSSARGFASRNRTPTVFIILDRTGRILYHTNEALKHQSASESMPYFLPVANRMLSSEAGRQSFTSPAGDEYSATYARIPTLDVSVAIASDNKEALADARRAGRIGFVVAVLLGVSAAGVLTTYFQRKARGIARVTEGVEAIAKGKLDHRIELQSSDDLRPLADNVGLMTKQLREQLARESETRQFQSFVRLSAILTHDLKNAIEALSLTVTNMERHFDNKEFRADAMKSLTSATENLRALVARLSNPITTLSGEHKRPRPVDLIPMLMRVISRTAEPARVSHEIKINLPESLFALVDLGRMNKVVENLIINALETMHKKKGTLSVVAGKTDDGKPFFSISDTGEGMSQRFIEEKLFHPFATTKTRGVGLGLYTCREVVRANGGSIEVDSREGAGTTFRVVLPSVTIDGHG